MSFGISHQQETLHDLHLRHLHSTIVSQQTNVVHFSWFDVITCKSKQIFGCALCRRFFGNFVGFF